MPLLRISTNVPASRIKTAAPPGAKVHTPLLKALSKAATKSVGKPEQWIMINVTFDEPLMFAGTEEPCASGTLTSIGSIGGAKNKEITKAVAEVLQSELGVSPDRFYLQFQDVTASDIGWNSSTFG